MPFTKENLATLYNLTTDKVDRVLSTSGLPLEQPAYSDEEIELRFKPVAMELFSQELTQLQGEKQANGKGKKSVKDKQKSTQNSKSDSIPSSLSREQILQHIQNLVAQAGGLSGEEFAQLLPDLANQRMAELIEMFDQGLLTRLSEMAQSGELEQMVRQTAAGKKSLQDIPSLFLEAEVIEESSSPRLLNESSSSKSSS